MQLAYGQCKTSATGYYVYRPNELENRVYVALSEILQLWVQRGTGKRLSIQRGNHFAEANALEER
ncbi:hypothetical protein M407DRAFT_207909 [Tulasnella calospora MUT 4182]|uniref:Uncharacterized protein n=1 Tax=Tulasnella calospora MUT 4182 TaxID=1051891 RepID=A0A0C3LWB2_9AGAM|nr:hypothetical protein M407DRAFT_207909 [Tulasnella calospora MUT 4182]